MAAKFAFSAMDQRGASREEVHYYTRAVGRDGRPLSLLIVNLSAIGLMARCDDGIEVGERLRVRLPVLGTVGAQARWALGGRMGCELDQPIGLADYEALLAAIARK